MALCLEGVLVLDKTTSSVDPAMEAGMYASLKRVLAGARQQAEGPPVGDRAPRRTGRAEAPGGRQGRPLRGAVRVCLTAGLRQGEALGLRWGDVDLEAGTLRVERQLQRRRGEDGQPGRLEFSEPKST